MAVAAPALRPSVPPDSLPPCRAPDHGLRATTRPRARPPGCALLPVALEEHTDANAGWSSIAERLYGRTMAAIDRRAGT